MKKPLISIVMPVYNAELYLRESINSILQQSFTDFELIIINDGSTDDTINIITSFQNGRISIIQNTHNYIRSLNLGVSKASGKYIVRMDSDDIMSTERLKIQYEFMEDHPDIDISGSYVQSFGKYNHIMKTPVRHSDIAQLMILQNPLFHPTIIMKRELLQSFPIINNIYQVYEENYIYSEDYRLWTQIAMKGYIFANIPDVLLNYRWNDTQVTNQRQNEMQKSTFKVQQEYLDYITKKILEYDSDFYDILNNTIHLYNNEKLSFHSLKQIIYNIYSEFKSYL